MLVKVIEPDFLFEDERGIIAQLVHEGYQQINVVTSKAGSVRGNFHYHQSNNETFYIVEGTISLETKFENINETNVFAKGDMFCIEKNIRHKFVFLEDTILIGLYDKGVSLEDGRKDIIED